MVDYAFSSYGISGRSDDDFVLSSGGVSISVPAVSPDNPSSSDDVVVTTVIESSETLSSVILSYYVCLLYTSPSPRDGLLSRMPSSA